MKNVWNYLKKYKGLLILTLGLAIINQVFSLLDPQIFRLIIDNYATKAATMDRTVFIHGVLWLLGGIIGVALISRIAKNFQDYYVNVITQKIGTGMYSNAVKHTLNLPYNIFEDERSGSILQKLQKARIDTQIIITTGINILFLSLVGIIFVIIYAFTVHWSIAVAYLSLIPILGTFAYFTSKGIKKAQKDIVKESTELAASTTETLRNVELVKSLGLEDQEIKRLNNLNNKILELELTKVKLIRKVSFMQGTAINALRAALLLLMMYLIFIQAITLGQFFSLFIYSFFIFGPLGEFGNVASQYQEAKASNEQLDQILKLKPEKKSKGKKFDKIKSIKFNNVSFTYKSANIASVNNINVDIESGNTIALAGPSGAGKSTIIKLIAGLYKPTKGAILINDTSGFDKDSFRRKIGLVSQDTQLFAGTIRENLLFTSPDSTDEDCIKVLKMAAVDNILKRADQGLDTKIGEQGIKVSGGEKQRLAIARALLRNPEIIIFDEATSSLDSITEKEITQTIKDIAKKNPNLIIIMVAHRLSTIMHADKIFVLENGHVEESGTHTQLLSKKGLYSALWREQNS